MKRSRYSWNRRRSSRSRHLVRASTGRQSGGHKKLYGGVRVHHRLASPATRLNGSPFHSDSDREDEDDAQDLMPLDLPTGWQVGC